MNRQVSGLFLTALISVFTLYATVGTAQSTKVFDGQYVVELAKSSAGGISTMSSHLERSGFGIDHTVGSDTTLITRQTVGALGISGKGRVKDFDPRDRTCDELIAKGQVISCSPNYQIHLYGTTPNDARLSELWGMSQASGIDAPDAWDVTTGSSDVVVAVIDTGIDYTHPDLRANVWTNPGEVPGNHVDDDHNGVVDDIYGANFVTNSGNPMDDNSHGTHVSGTIGGLGNNTQGVVGVNWHVKIMALKFLDGQGSGSLAGAIQAIDYMVAMKKRGVNIRVSSNSWGGGGYSDALMKSIRRARDAGIVFVAAAGNETNNNDLSPSYPAGYELSNVVSVAAIDQNHNLASFSNYGEATVDIAAPGVNILSTTPNNTYSVYSGTSMATPHVSGALALLFSSEPTLTANQAIARLYESGVDSETMNGLVRTGRLLNVSRMVRNITVPVPPSAGATPPCNYIVQEIPFRPDTSADDQPIVLQADEGNYYTLNLPFDFPFERGHTNVLYLSPNGVVYTKGAPMAMDYMNGAMAPFNSIALLHTDLVADRGELGVRALVQSDRVTLVWRAKHYISPQGGEVTLRATLFDDGRIEEYVSFSSSELERVVREVATMGLTGSNPASAITYAYDNSNIRNSLALRYAPACDQIPAGAAGVSHIQVRSKRGARLSTTARPGSNLQLNLRGLGTGNVLLRASFDSRRCPGYTLVPMQSGKASVKATVPQLLQERFRSLRFSVTAVTGGIRLTQPPGTSRAKRATAKRFSGYCAQLFQSLR